MVAIKSLLFSYSTDGEVDSEPTQAVPGGKKVSSKTKKKCKRSHSLWRKSMKDLSRNRVPPKRMICGVVRQSVTCVLPKTHDLMKIKPTELAHRICEKPPALQQRYYMKRLEGLVVYDQDGNVVPRQESPVDFSGESENVKGSTPYEADDITEPTNSTDKESQEGAAEQADDNQEAAATPSVIQLETGTAQQEDHNYATPSAPSSTQLETMSEILPGEEDLPLPVRFPVVIQVEDEVNNGSPLSSQMPDSTLPSPPPLLYYPFGYPQIYHPTSPKSPTLCDPETEPLPQLRSIALMELDQSIQAAEEEVRQQEEKVRRIREKLEAARQKALQKDF
jgi:hypothetical protein